MNDCSERAPVTPTSDVACVKFQAPLNFIT